MVRRESERALIALPARPTVRSCTFRSPYDPDITRTVCANGVGARMSFENESTPAEPLPNNDDVLPRSTSTRSMFPSSMLVSWLWPSARVCGTPSRKTCTPRRPKFARAPAPRIAMRLSVAKL